MDNQRKTNEDGSLSLRIDLKPELAQLLFDIMDERKFSYYAETIRYCINEVAKHTEFNLGEGYWNKIQNYLK